MFKNKEENSMLSQIYLGSKMKLLFNIFLLIIVMFFLLSEVVSKDKKSVNEDKIEKKIDLVKNNIKSEIAKE